MDTRHAKDTTANVTQFDAPPTQRSAAQTNVAAGKVPVRDGPADPAAALEAATTRSEDSTDARLETELGKSGAEPKTDAAQINAAQINAAQINAAQGTAALSNAPLGPLHWSGIGVTFVSTRSQACPYLPGKTERKLIAPITRTARRRFSSLNEAGFRRSNAFVYRPICSHCQACMAARVLVDQFKPSKTQRRIARRNAGLRLEMASAMATEEHYELFRRYLDERHFDGDMALMDEDDFAAMIEETSVRTNVFEWREPESQRLLAACLVDHLDDGFSMVYSYYDPDQPSRSLGVAMILSLIALAAKADLPHVYLGYWVEGSRKMSYKQSYAPLEVYDQGRWRLLAGPTPSQDDSDKI